MKTLKKVPVKYVRLNVGEFMPEQPQPDTIYYSPSFRGCLHLCLCGCGHKCWLPISGGHWDLSAEEGKVTITPSIQQLFECRSHYIITNGVANFV